MLHMERQPGEVDLRAGFHHFVHRRLVRGHLEGFLRIGHAARVFLAHFLLRDTEGGGKTLARRRHGGDYLVLLRPRLAE